jgi:glycyl-tRNA synthetase beta chain
MGGIYAREEGLPEEIWKAIYFHYLPIGVEADAPPSAAQLGAAAVTWASVSLADKLDSVVGMFAAGERPTGSRDPLGLRRQAQGLVKILADLPELTGITSPVRLWSLVAQAGQSWGLSDESQQALNTFLRERAIYLFEQRGHDIRNVRAVVPERLHDFNVVEARRTLEALVQMSGSDALRGVAALFKRVKNISKNVAPPASLADISGVLTEPAERALLEQLQSSAPAIREAARRSDYRAAFTAIAALQPAVATFFDDVLVMAEEERLRAARLGLVATLRDLIMGIADISEIVTES